MELPHLLQKQSEPEHETVKSQQYIQVKYQVRRLKVACVSIPEAGHLVPTVQVAKALAYRGHEAYLVTMDSAASKFAKGCEAVNCRFRGLVKGLAGSDAGHGPIAELMSKGLVAQAFSQYNHLMHQELLDLLRDEGPFDMVLADFATMSAIQVAEELSIPCVINVPGPAELLKHLSMWLAIPFCSAVFLATRSVLETRLIYKMFLGLIPAMKRHVCLVNSFFGLDMPCALPANVILTGSTALRPGRERIALKETSDEKMNAWLQQVRAEGLRIVYVTMGSMQVLEQFQLEALFYGLKSLTPKVAVAWSLKEEQHQQLPGGIEALPSHFFVQKWLPQGEALQLGEVAVVVTHCGFGGLNETIAAGKPLVALPFRADQPANAKLAKERGLAEVLKPRKLTPASVKSALQKVLGDPSYAQRARELQGMMLKTKGAEACVEAIERFVENDGCDEFFLRAPPSWSSYVTPWVKPLCLLALGAALGVAARRQ